MTRRGCLQPERPASSSFGEAGASPGAEGPGAAAEGPGAAAEHCFLRPELNAQSELVSLSRECVCSTALCNRLSAALLHCEFYTRQKKKDSDRAL